MITVTLLAGVALGMIFAPRQTRDVLKALSRVIQMLVVVLLIFARVFPSSGGSSNRMR